MTELILAFPGESTSRANKLASSLCQAIASRGFSDSVERLRKDDSSMDAGTLLSVVLGAPSLAMLVTAIKDWALRNYRGTVEISRGETIVKLENIAIADVDELVRALSPLFEAND